MNIAYSCDENYVQHTGISIISLLDNNQESAEINIYFIERNVSEKSLELLNRIVASYGRKFFVIPFEKISFRLKTAHVGRHVETIYAKLFFGNIKNLDKIFYLDSDTIVTNSLETLWNTNLDGFYFGCVKTITKDPCEALGISKSEDFFNDGVALVNTAALREDKMEDKFLQYISRFNGNPPFLSEGTINVVCKGKILALNPTYNLSSGFLMFQNEDLRVVACQPLNFYSDEQLESAKTNPIVIHYLAGWFKRPWEKGCSHPMKAHYEKYKAQSPWRDEPYTARRLSLKIKILRIAYHILPVRWVLALQRLISKMV